MPATRNREEPGHVNTDLHVFIERLLLRAGVAQRAGQGAEGQPGSRIQRAKLKILPSKI